MTHQSTASASGTWFQEYVLVCHGLYCGCWNLFFFFFSTIYHTLMFVFIHFITKGLGQCTLWFWWCSWLRPEDSCCEGTNLKFVRFSFSGFPFFSWILYFSFPMLAVHSSFHFSRSTRSIIFCLVQEIGWHCATSLGFPFYLNAHTRFPACAFDEKKLPLWG